MGSAATATWSSCSTWRRCGCSRGCPAPRWCSATWPGSTTTTRPWCSRRDRILKAQVAARRRPWAGRVRRHRARVQRLQRHLRGGLGRRLPRPDPGQPVQRRLLAARHQPGRAAAARHPQPHVRRRAQGRVRQGRVQPRPARDRVPSTTRCVRTADQHAVYKNGAKEIAAQHGQALTFMAKFDEREGNSCHVHMSLRGVDGEIVFDEGDGPTRDVRPLRGRRAGDARGLHPALRAEHQLLQAVPARVVRADGDRVGPRQPHLRAAGRRPRAGLRVENRAPRRRRQPVPRPGRHAGRRPARHRERAGARARLRGQRLRVRQAPRADDAAGGARRVRGLGSWPARPSATTSSTTTSTRPTSSWPRSTPR